MNEDPDDYDFDDLYAYNMFVKCCLIFVKLAMINFRKMNHLKVVKISSIPATNFVFTMCLLKLVNFASP